mmetsp:Transcript_103652/g.299826  ORF Transcript_103652/g.299826 Transcript_103652/m.299826 type:complete len:217 (+) Transcript_103652:734-1384(+)
MGEVDDRVRHRESRQALEHLLLGGVDAMGVRGVEGEDRGGRRLGLIGGVRLAGLRHVPGHVAGHPQAEGAVPVLQARGDASRLDCLEVLAEEGEIHRSNASGVEQVQEEIYMCRGVELPAHRAQLISRDRSAVVAIDLPPDRPLSRMGLLRVAPSCPPPGEQRRPLAREPLHAPHNAQLATGASGHATRRESERHAEEVRSPELRAFAERGWAEAT